MSKTVVRSFSIISVLAILLAQFGLSSVAAAANFTVNSTADAVDAEPGDGLCETRIPGECTLRAAVQETNVLPGENTITIPAGTYYLSIAGAWEDNAATGDLDITDDLVITGAGMGVTLLDGNELDRILDIRGGALELSDLAIQNGIANPGGAVRVGMYASIKQVAFLNYRSTSVEPDGSVGAVFVGVEASADIIRSKFLGNFAYYGGGAVASSSTNTFTITDSTFNSNTSVFGGGALYPNGEYMLVRTARSQITAPIRAEQSIATPTWWRSITAHLWGTPRSTAAPSIRALGWS